MLNVFLSVGRTFRPEQEAFVKAVEEYLRDNGVEPQAMNRNRYFYTGQPLKDTTELMKQCSGTVVIAFERKYIRDGAEKRDSPDEEPITNQTIPTVWNHIEPVQAYMLGQPVLVIAEQSLHSEGVLEAGYEWGVQRMPLDPAALHDRRFVGVFRAWKEAVEKHHEARQVSVDEQTPKPDPGRLTVKQLFESLTLGQLWAIIVALFTAVAAIAGFAYWLGTTFAGGS